MDVPIQVRIFFHNKRLVVYVAFTLVPYPPHFFLKKLHFHNIKARRSSWFWWRMMQQDLILTVDSRLTHDWVWQHFFNRTFLNYYTLFSSLWVHSNSQNLHTVVLVSATNEEQNLQRSKIDQKYWLIWSFTKLLRKRSIVHHSRGFRSCRIYRRWLHRGGD